ncbi:MAG: major capsid protein [Campylobacteraceae bacterium]
MLKELIAKFFIVATVLKIIDQIKAAPSFVYDKYFKGNEKAVLGDSVHIPIKKGAGIVLESVSPNAEHLIHEESDKFIITVKLPRFPLESTITANELNTIKSLESQTEQVETLAQKVGDLLKEHKDSYITTIEHMCVGALFGKVTDGKGNILFEFSSSAAPTEFKGKTIVNVLNEIDKDLENELGTVPAYDVLASRTFIGRLADKALSEKLFDQGQATWLNENNRRVFVVYGKKFIPYSATYKNAKGQTKEFIVESEAIVTPDSPDVYQFFYGRADHTEAVGKKPTLFFAATPEELPKGRGYSIVSETKPIPACVRPGTLRKLKFSE